jgi:catechol 2,3-dioxygenase-like lactoylglutathione lyase family enzyme
MTMPARINLVTLGVADVARSTAFYTALGWTPSSGSQPEITFIQLGAIVLGLFGHDDLADDARLPRVPQPPFRGTSLAINLDSEDAVDAAMATAHAAGATVVKQPEKVFWGGYSGYFTDPDGHLWELAHNPHWTINSDGSVSLPE